ncbi:MAG: filamentous hemagglutinin N-terminal domain-containing protein, partial [Verrucomicrobiota bacterium]
NWQDFSILSNETTRFIQPSSSSAVLNRVLGGNPSSILGSLSANGKVYLINPNGIVVGSGANINCNSFIASTLDVKDVDFLRGGDLTFSGNSTASIVNLGKITASEGDVFLMARQVQNLGSIEAKQGNVGLAAGTEILLRDSGNEKVFVKAGAVTNGTGVDHQGVIDAIRTELKSAGSVYSLAINAGGTINATQFQEVGGEVYLRAPGGKIKQTGIIHAQGTQQGGKVVV